MLPTENSSNAVPVPPGQVPVQPLVYSNQMVEQVDADRVGMERVMQFVGSTFAGAQLMDSHTVSSILWAANVTFNRAVIVFKVLKELRSLERT